MSKKIKSTFIKLTNTPVDVIKGRFGYHTNIKDIYVVNNSTANSFLSVYILDKDLIKTYICNNISIPPNKRFEIPHDGNIEIETKEHIFAETKKPTDLDIFCNYIETEKTINTVEIQFQNQNETVTDVYWSIIDTGDSNKKIIRFAENPNYSYIPDILYEINGLKFIIYKTPNLKIPIHDFKEFDDRFEIDFYSLKDNILFSNFQIQSYINISFNIVESPQWKYNTINSFDDTISWNNASTNISLIANSYYLNFKDVDGYTKPSNFLFEILKDNLVNLNLEYTSNLGNLKVITDYNINDLTWRLIDGYSGEDLSEDYYLNSLIMLEEGTHTIKIDGIDGVFDTVLYQVYIHKNQSHYIKHLINLGDAQIQILSNIETTWEIDGSWYNSSEIVTITEGTYSITYADIDDYDKPLTHQVILNHNVKTVITNNYISHNGQVKISKPSLLDDSVAKGIKWRLINNSTQEKSNWFTYDTEHTTINGEYVIEFQSIEDYFASFTASLLVYKSQQTVYVMNNSILN